MCQNLTSKQMGLEEWAKQKAEEVKRLAEKGGK